MVIITLQHQRGNQGLHVTNSRDTLIYALILHRENIKMLYLTKIVRIAHLGLINNMMYDTYDADRHAR